ncbi:hypothetical protein NP493_1397g00026 [Ridgeia piscesae]|uniref:L-Fucosyltransferase n=1 Tax=Ridgeia piscesae TaxID=27915 RepID=A0AAD9K4V0_RIDPI|nr:hypothetical protein NP493_1397g00026 [Ridgeia piscesae]
MTVAWGSSKRGRARTGGMTSSRHVTFILFAAILSVPFVSIYIGYAIGVYMMPANIELPDSGVIIGPLRLNYTWYNTHNLSVTFGGRLGNNMFQYAALYGIGKANGLRPLITRQSALVAIFPHLKTRVTSQRRPGDYWPKYREMAPYRFDERTFNLNFMTNIELVGFFQSWRYFDHVRADVRKQFTFAAGLELEVTRFFERTQRLYRDGMYYVRGDAAKSPLQYVGIHVRRGDYLHQNSIEKGYTVADSGYIERAMSYFTTKYHNVIFVVCSDDMQWSRTHVKSRTHLVVYSPFTETAALDLCTLARCNHSITTVGSFSWWVGNLAGGETIYYKDFPKRGSWVASIFKPGDYYMPQWITV